MPTLRDLLRRWRPAGAAARAGAPCDRTAQPELELAGVLGALQSVQAECRTIRDAAARDAHLTTMCAQEKAEAIIVDTRTAAAGQGGRRPPDCRPADLG